jgi:hypothetical protein
MIAITEKAGIETTDIFIGEGEAPLYEHTGDRYIGKTVHFIRKDGIVAKSFISILDGYDRIITTLPSLKDESKFYYEEYTSGVIKKLTLPKEG